MIKHYQVLAENEEHIPDHKKIRKFLKRTTASEMGAVKDAIAAAQ